MQIDRATIEDIPACKHIASQWRVELGFVNRAALAERQQRGTLLVAWRDRRIVGFCDYNVTKRGENAGYSVVYHLAIDKAFLRQGVGSALLDAVPHPIRLTTITDSEACKFYESIGFTNTSNKQGKVNKLSLYQRSAVMILIHGGNHQTPQWANKAQWEYGAKGDCTLYAPPYMLDHDWRKDGDEAWQNHIELMKQHKPRQSVVIDFEHIGQRRIMLQRCGDALLSGVVPIVVPKFVGAVKHIPRSGVIVGISVPTKHAGFLPQRSELSGRTLHLLGGHPDQWRFLMDYYNNASVFSLDGNAFTQVCRDYGKLWSRNGYYRELRGKGFNTNALIIASMRNARRYLESRRKPSLAAKRIVRCLQYLDVIPTQLPLFSVA
jgi:GNAT superfamily N-acetyltransferase